MQKLALARALYKNAPVIILDEPTAALDPIAESRVYAQYAELTEGKTLFNIQAHYYREGNVNAELGGL